jgi:hypothetical protein
VIGSDIFVGLLDEIRLDLDDAQLIVRRAPIRDLRRKLVDKRGVDVAPQRRITESLNAGNFGNRMSLVTSSAGLSSEVQVRSSFDEHH